MASTNGFHETRITRHETWHLGIEALQSCFCRFGLLSMRTVRRESPVLSFSPSGEAKSMWVTRHETRPLQPFGSLWLRKVRATKNRRPDRRTGRPVIACLRAVEWLWCGWSGCGTVGAAWRGILPLSQFPRSFRRSRSASRRAPLAVVPSSYRLVPLRRTHNGSVLRKGNVLDGVDITIGLTE